MTKTQAIIYLSNHGIDEEHIENIIDAFSQEPRFFPPCVDCTKRMEEIRLAYDRFKSNSDVTDAYSVHAES
jgi:hypothetical protein